MRRPDPSEYAEYYGLYINQVPAGDVFTMLGETVRRTTELLSSLTAEQESYRYAPDKWTIREVVGHLSDVERLFGYRALAIARADPSPMPGMDQDLWVERSNAGERSLASLLAELGAGRQANIATLSSFEGEVWDRRGIASDCEFTVRTFPYILVGHETHHQRVLEEKYLAPLGVGGAA